MPATHKLSRLTIEAIAKHDATAAAAYAIASHLIELGYPDHSLIVAYQTVAADQSALARSLRDIVWHPDWSHCFELERYG